MIDTVIPTSVAFLFGIICAKWALELGFSQMSQFIHFIAGLFVGPLVLLILYVRLIRKAKKFGEPGGQYYGSDNQQKDAN